MCGIAGILNRFPTPDADQRIIRRMLGLIRHRGPDEFGLYLDEDVVLGNARLSIVDLSGGQQPISNEDGTLWIVFNGEIFNYVELRAELIARGHEFKTNSDTEVILHLFEDSGVDSFARLNGQWAIAIWDTARKRLVLARDRVGVRPLFYCKTPDHLVFASEIKSLAAHPDVSTEIDPASLEQVFTYWSTIGSRTTFRDIQQINPGHFLIADAAGFVEKPFWEMGFPPKSHVNSPASLSYEFPENGTAEDMARALRDLLLDATRVRLRADVPVGAYLSGGLDSSIIAACVRQLNLPKFDTFSIAFEHPDYDESAFQKQMSRALGTDHQVAYVTDSNIGRVFPDIVWHVEAPLMRTGPAPMFLLSKLVRQSGYKVVLTGEGADEFFGGYDIFKEAKIRNFWGRQPESKWRASLLQRLYPDINRLGSAGAAYLQAFFGRGLTEFSNPFYSHLVRWTNSRRTCRFLSPTGGSEGRSAVDNFADLAVPAEFSSWTPFQRAQYWESTIFLPHYLLSSQGDRVGMANSIEGRFPFLDVRIVDFASRLPTALKMRGLTEKYLLRKAFGAWLPPEIRLRRKRPYRAPIHRSFMSENSSAYVPELLSESALRQSGYFNILAVRQLVRKLQAGNVASETDEMALVGIISTQLLASEFSRRVRSTAPISDRDNVKVIAPAKRCLET